MPVGRPTIATPEILDAICDRIAEGESLRDICACDDMPGRTAVLKWLANDAEFASQYARAREAQGDVMDDMIMAEALSCDASNAAAARVRIDAFKWRAGKLKPKVYGEKVEHTGTIRSELVQLTPTEANL